MDYSISITVTPSGCGSVDLNPNGTSAGPYTRLFAEGTYVTITAIDTIPGYVFKRWEGTIGTSTERTITILVNWNWVLTAVFETAQAPTEYCDLYTSANGSGSVLPTYQRVQKNLSLQVVAAPNIGNLFSSWSGDITGCTPVAGEPNILNVVMSTDRNIIGNFTADPNYVLTGLTSVTPNCTDGQYKTGSVLPFSISCQYKGRAQSGSYKAQIGYISSGQFVALFETGLVSVSFPYKLSYNTVSFTGQSLYVPAGLTANQRYVIKIILNTSDGLSASGVSTTSFQFVSDSTPPAISTDMDSLTLSTGGGTFDIGATVPAHITYRYKGINQGGTVQLIIAEGLLVTPVYTFPEHTTEFLYSESMTTYALDTSFELPAILTPGNTYKLKVVLRTADGKVGTQALNDAFVVSSSSTQDPTVGEYVLARDHVYDYGKVYSGAAQEATGEFTIALNQLPGTDWISNNVVDAFEQKVEDEGAKILAIKVYERNVGLLDKQFKIIVTAVPPVTTTGQEVSSLNNEIFVADVEAQGIILWAVIFLAALALVAILITMINPTMREIVWGEGGVVDTVTDTFGLLGQLLPMMMVMMMMGIIEEQSRTLYEQPGQRTQTPISDTSVKIAKGAWKVGGEVAKAGSKVAKASISAAESFAGRVSEELERRKEAKAAEKEREDELIKERAAEKRQKLDEALAKLNKRRQES